MARFLPPGAPLIAHSPEVCRSSDNVKADISNIEATHIQDLRKYLQVSLKALNAEYESLLIMLVNTRLTLRAGSSTYGISMHRINLPRSR